MQLSCSIMIKMKVSENPIHTVIKWKSKNMPFRAYKQLMILTTLSSVHIVGISVSSFRSKQTKPNAILKDEPRFI